ncbi:MAG: hypothetical protein CBD74_15240 [Saprospirales bacterium TMED214]|nr:MAG: hypothetical protein CBD74_15240 [Saprospirales bacterium TMED214]
MVLSDSENLRAQEAALERQLAEIRKQRIVAEKKEGQTASPRRAVREFVLDLLMDAGFALNSLLIASIMPPLYGKKISSSRFGTLSTDEAKSFDSARVRPVYLCHLLKFDDAQPIKRYWARSDWPLSDRIYGPHSSRLLFLKAAKWTVELADARSDAVDAERLHFVAADQARSAGLKVVRGEFPFADWSGSLTEEIDRLDSIDTEERERAAAAIADELNPRELLYGSQGGLLSLPGTQATYRSA